MSQANRTKSWSQRYGTRHRFNRMTEFPQGLMPPKRVRIYHRSGGLLLQWWEPSEKKNVSQPIDGDLLTALAKAREIDERLETKSDSGARQQRFTLNNLIDRYLGDLEARVRAGDISIRTLERYRPALAHLERFALLPEIQRNFRKATSINRAFTLKFRAFLSSLSVSPNGHPNTKRQPMRSTSYVLDVSRALFEWASDPDRGALLPENFRNPFLRRFVRNQEPAAALESSPPITQEMAVEFLRAADDHAFHLFLPIVLFGLRATEPCYLFVEHLHDGWLDVPNIPDLRYVTKGRRSKRFPLPKDVERVFRRFIAGRKGGLLFRRRGVSAGGPDTPLFERALEELTKVFQIRIVDSGHDAAGQEVVRDRLLREAGGLTYDDIHAEFQRISHRLKWPRTATIKGFRHLFATTMTNAGMPEPYRKFFMGHAPGRDPIVGYTHLDRARHHLETALKSECSGMLRVVRDRSSKTGPLPIDSNAKRPSF